MKTLGVFANCSKHHAPAVLERLRVKAGELGVKLVPDRETAKLMGLPAGAAEGSALFASCDVMMVLGGDGSMLRAVRELNGRDIPLIGVNLGALGFLTSVTEGDLERALDCLIREDYTTSDRVIVDGTVHRGGERLGSYCALNDVVVKSVRSRVVTLRMRVDGQEVGDFVCDGLIVSTPTGSTGYSLSAGGPVLMPSAQALVVSLICPHTLSTRPLVLPHESTVEVTVIERSAGAEVSVDGQVGQPLEMGDGVTVKRSKRGARFIHLPGYDYFSVLRQKLHWRGSNV
jgi:NAD+ kinase